MLDSIKKKQFKILKSLGNTSPGLSMTEFKDLYIIYAIDLSAHAIVSKTNQLTINVVRIDVFAQNAETLQNPRKLDAFL